MWIVLGLGLRLRQSSQNEIVMLVSRRSYSGSALVSAFINNLTVRPLVAQMSSASIEQSLDSNLLLFLLPQLINTLKHQARSLKVPL